MKETTKGYEVITRLWDAKKGGFVGKTKTFDSVKAAFTFANNFISANSDREKDEVDVWVYDNSDNSDIFRMVYGRKGYGKPVMVGNRNAQCVDYKAIMEEVIAEAENAADEKMEVTADNAESIKTFRPFANYGIYSAFHRNLHLYKTLQRTENYITVTYDGHVHRHKIVVNEYGKEMINVSGCTGRRAVFLKADDFIGYTVENTVEEPENNEVTVDIAESEKTLRNIKDYADKCKRDIAYYSEQIIEYYGYIAKCENFILKAYLDAEDAEKEAAKIESAIANQRLIDVTDEIVTADAVDASVDAMINSANDFSAEMLMAAITKAEKAVEIVPVTFELQHFAADIVTADVVATIDTALSNTVNLPISDVDEVVEIKAIYAEIDNLEREEKAIDNQIEKLLAKKKHIRAARSELESKVIDSKNDINTEVRSVIQNAFDSSPLGMIELKSGGMLATIAGWHLTERVVGSSLDKDGVSIWIKSDTPPYEKLEIVRYSTVKQFKKVVRELAAAIERGDKKFTFPADIPPAYEYIPFDEDDCFIDELDEEEIAANLWF